MTETIKEAAREAVRKEYLCEKCAWKDNCDFCRGVNTPFDCCECSADSYEDGFKAGVNYVYELPLAQRLTAEEKERVRKTYVAARDGYWDECNNLNIAVESVLEDIFGADFFKEGE